MQFADKQIELASGDSLTVSGSSEGLFLSGSSEGSLHVELGAHPKSDAPTIVLNGDQPTALGQTLGLEDVDISGLHTVNAIITGNADDNQLKGAGGADVLTGGGGADILFGGEGNDTIDGSDGNDTAQFNGNLADYTISNNGGGLITVVDVRNGSPDGTDTLKNIESLSFADQTVHAPQQLIGVNAANTLLSLSGATSDVVDVDLSSTHLFIKQSGFPLATGVNLAGINDVDATSLSAPALSVEGNDAANHLTGSTTGDTLAGEAGDDVLTGGGGSDELDGGAGSDTAVFSGTVADYSILSTSDGLTVTDLRSGAPDGVDTLTSVEFLQFADGLEAAPAPASLSASANDGALTLSGAGAPDQTVSVELADGIASVEVAGQTLSINGDNSSIEVVTASLVTGGGLTITGDSVNNVLGGSEAADTLDGQAGEDLLIGGGGADTISGGDGDDTLNGGGRRRSS